MERKHRRLPVMIGRRLRTGILCCKGLNHLRGLDVLIVGLKQDYDPGALFHLGDVEWVKTHLHFCDRESLQRTVDVLNQALKDWKEEDN